MPILSTAAQRAKEDAESATWRREQAALKKGLVAAPPPAPPIAPSTSIAQNPQQSQSVTHPTTHKPLETPIPGELAIRPEQEVTGEQSKQHTEGASDLPTPTTEAVKVNLQAAAVLETKGDDAKAASEKQNPSHADPVPISTGEVKNSVACLDRLPPQDTKPAESNPVAGIADKPRHQSADERVHPKSDSARKAGEADRTNDSKPYPEVAVSVSEALLQHKTEVEKALLSLEATSPVYEDHRARRHEDNTRDRMRGLSLDQLILMVPALRDLKPGPYPLGKPYLCPPVLTLRCERGRITAHLYIPSPAPRKRNPMAPFEPPKRNRERRLGSALKLRDIVRREIIARRDTRGMHEIRAS